MNGDGVAEMEDRRTVIEDRCAVVIKDSGDVIEDRGAMIDDRGMLIEDRGATIEDRGATIEDRGAMIEDRGAKIEDRGAMIEDRGAIAVLSHFCPQQRSIPVGLAQARPNNVLWGQYASELKGLMKKLLFSILHISMQNCKSIVAMVFECYFFITSSCIVMYVHACIIHYNEMMMSVLQEIKGLTKELYFIILSRRKSSFHANFRSTDYTIMF